MTRRPQALASALALLAAPLAGCLLEVPPLVDEDVLDAVVGCRR